MERDIENGSFLCALRRKLSLFLSGVLDFVYPDIYCIGCGAIIDKSRPYCLCDACREKFHFAVGKTCAKCGRVLSDDYPHNLCNKCASMLVTDDSGFASCKEGSSFACQEEDDTFTFDGEADGAFAFERGFTCLMYGLYEKEMLQAFKYHDNPYFARALGEMMYDRIEPLDLEFDIVTSVPLHRKKLRERGYNQAELLAKEVAKRAGAPYVSALVRTRYTKPMSKVSGAERSMNLSSSKEESVFAFKPSCREVVSGKRILLIDDIYTSGATADSCARVLRKNGAKTVFVLTVASAGNPPPTLSEL